MPSEVAARKWVWKERFQFLFWKTSTLGECRVCSGGWGNLSCVCFLTRREVDDLAYPGCVREFEKRWQQREKSSNAIGEKKKKKWSCCTGDTHFCTFLSVLVKTTTWNCYIPNLSLNKTSTVIGWFLVTCPWSNSNLTWFVLIVNFNLQCPQLVLRC